MIVARTLARLFPMTLTLVLLCGCAGHHHGISHPRDYGTIGTTPHCVSSRLIRDPLFFGHRPTRWRQWPCDYITWRYSTSEHVTEEEELIAPPASNSADGDDVRREELPNGSDPFKSEPSRPDAIEPNANDADVLAPDPIELDAIERDAAEPDGFELDEFEPEDIDDSGIDRLPTPSGGADSANEQIEQEEFEQEFTPNAPIAELDDTSDALATFEATE